MGINFILVHYHRKLFPDYIYDCIEQIRITNPEAKIYLAYFPSCQVDYQRLQKSQCELVNIGGYAWSFMHYRFKLKNRGIFTTERFFVIYEIMKRYHLKDVIHVENDVLVYYDISKIVDVLRANYDIGFVRESDTNCIAGFMYIKEAKFLKPLCQFFVKEDMSDMEGISEYGHRNGLHYLPVVSENYTLQEKMDYGRRERIVVRNPEQFCENVDKFSCVFDGAAYGQYIGGLDPKLGKKDTIGYINPNACFNPEKCGIVWEIKDNKKVPFYAYGKEKLPIVNLHIHSKELRKYRSDSKMK